VTTKEHILGEIKRTAKVNGGAPLGWRKFEQETGIKEFEWFGKLWARWSDALREAGFAPNQLTSAYDKNELLEKYAKLAHELNRLPTSGDLRLKTRSDSNFPSNSAFENRFGTKLKLVKELKDYCNSHNKHKNVACLCVAYVSPNRNVSEEVKIKEGQIGFVYLIKSGRFHKIGKANSTGRREYEIGLQLPEKATTIHVIRTDDPSGIESYWHNRFVQKRKNGEWFDLSAADISIFKRRKFM
jgi:hypothetical protein